MYQWDFSNLSVLRKCEIPDNVALYLSFYLNGWVTLGLELQDQLCLSDIGGDAAADSLDFCVIVSCMFFV